MACDAKAGGAERQVRMAMSCRKPPQKDNDHCKPRPKKCDRGHGHGHHGDKRKKCRSHSKPWRPPVRNGGHDRDRD